MSRASAIIDKMYNNDPFSQWLGIQRLDEGPGYCTLSLKVIPAMLNGFALAHGGITYSLADSALAFAANGHGIQCVSVDTSISHTKAVKEGDVLTAIAKEISCGKNTGVYQVIVKNQSDVTVAVFKGTVFRTGKLWDVS